MNRRRRHSSIATDKYAFVFAGFDINADPTDSIERLALTAENDSQGNAKPRKWEAFTLPGLTPRAYPMMAKISDTHVLVIGGFKGGWLSDGIIFNSETLKIRSSVNSGVGFTCKGNPHVVTQKGTIIAVIEDP